MSRSLSLGVREYKIATCLMHAPEVKIPVENGIPVALSWAAFGAFHVCS